MSWYKKSEKKESLFWKHHLTSDFKNGGAPISNNGTGIGGTLFRDLSELVRRFGKEKYWVVPVMLSEEEYIDNKDGTVDSKVTKIGIGDFAPISYWEKQKLV